MVGDKQHNSFYVKRGSPHGSTGGGGGLRRERMKEKMLFVYEKR